MITAPYMVKETSSWNYLAYFMTLMTFFGKSLHVIISVGVIEKYIFLANLRIGHERVIGKF
jgi:hypothetical protein